MKFHGYNQSHTNDTIKHQGRAVHTHVLAHKGGKVDATGKYHSGGTGKLEACNGGHESVLLTSS